MGLLAIALASNSNNVQAQFWTEDFLPENVFFDWSANGYVGINGTWTETQLPGDTGVYANRFFISCQEAGMHINNCGAECPPVPLPSPFIGQCLHISNSIVGDNGAHYFSFGSGNQCNTEVRAESPIIDCSGNSNIILKFNYIEYGDSTNDNADVWYFDGSIWSFLFDMNKTLCGDGIGGPCNAEPCDDNNQGYWTSSPDIPLPISADHNPNVKIGFRWINNDDTIATDPSIAVTRIQLFDNGGLNLNRLDRNEAILIYPNPAENNATIAINAAINETVGIMLYNSLGQLISEEKLKLNSGHNMKNIDLQNYNNGMYTVRVTGNHINAMKQLIKK